MSTTNYPFGRTLYRPTEYEVAATAKHAKTKHPHAARIIDEAQELVLSGALDYDTRAGSWICTTSIALNKHVTLGPKTCTCQFFRDRLLTLNGYPFCVHKIALMLLHRVLATHLRQRISGNVKFHAEAEHARSHANELLLFTPNGNAVAVFGSRTWRVPKDLCATRWSMQGTDFKSLTDMYAFSLWLAQAHPLPQDLLMPLLSTSNDPEDIFQSMKQQGFSDYAAAMATDALVMDERTWHQTYDPRYQDANQRRTA